MNASGFANLIDRLRRGEEDAVQVLLEQYSEAIRRELRFSMPDGRLRRLVSESDVCESVNTRLRLWAGKYD